MQKAFPSHSANWTRTSLGCFQSGGRTDIWYCGASVIDIMLYRKGKMASTLGLLVALVDRVGLWLPQDALTDRLGLLSAIAHLPCRSAVARRALHNWICKAKAVEFFVASIGPAVVICFILRFVMAPEIFASALANEDQLPLRVWPVKLIREQCTTIRESAIESEAEVVVFLRVPDLGNLRNSWPWVARSVRLPCPQPIWPMVIVGIGVGPEFTSIRSRDWWWAVIQAYGIRPWKVHFASKSYAKRIL